MNNSSLTKEQPTVTLDNVEDFSKEELQDLVLKLQLKTNKVEKAKAKLKAARDKEKGKNLKNITCLLCQIKIKQKREWQEYCSPHCRTLYERFRSHIGRVFLQMEKGRKIEKEFHSYLMEFHSLMLINIEINNSEEPTETKEALSHEIIYPLDIFKGIVKKVTGVDFKINERAYNSPTRRKGNKTKWDKGTEEQEEILENEKDINRQLDLDLDIEREERDRQLDLDIEREEQTETEIEEQKFIEGLDFRLDGASELVEREEERITAQTEEKRMEDAEQEREIARKLALKPLTLPVKVPTARTIKAGIAKKGVPNEVSINHIHTDWKDMRIMKTHDRLKLYETHIEVMKVLEKLQKLYGKWKVESMNPNTFYPMMGNFTLKTYGEIIKKEIDTEGYSTAADIEGLLAKKIYGLIKNKQILNLQQLDGEPNLSFRSRVRLYNTVLHILWADPDFAAV